MTDLVQITAKSTTPPTLATATLTKVDRAETNAAIGPWRGHLGASQIGRDCAREVWYSWRWATLVQHPPRLLRLFERGHREEPAIVSRLLAIGCEVITHADDGSQIRLKHPDHGGHVSGSCDGLLYGLPEAPDRWAVLECKTAGAKAHRAVVKSGVRRAKPEHWTQMQLYMQWAGLDVALYWSVCKDDDHVHAEIVPRDDDPATLDAIEDRILSVVDAQQPPPRPYDSPTSPPCSWCDHSSVCWSARPSPLPTCRTCARAIVSMEGGGTWRCGRDGRALTPRQQYEGCPHREPLITDWTP